MTIKVSEALTDFVRPSEHSTFSPSGADRWIACPYSINACKPIPEETSKYAAEGTKAHTVCEDYFAHMHYGIPKSPELMMADDEMMESAVMWYSVVTGWLDHPEIGEVLWFGLEKGIPIFPEKDCYGTADAVIVGTKGCAIIDFKYGKGKAVSAQSTQLKTYLLGVFRHLTMKIGSNPEQYKYHAVIVQPRTDDLPKHHCYGFWDMKAFEDVVAASINHALTSTDLIPVEGNHCYWCKAKRTLDPNLKCPLIKEKAERVSNENFDKFLSDMNAPIDKVGDPNDKRDKAIIKVMSLLPLMKQIASDGEEEFLHRIQQGETIPGVSIVEKVGRRQWALTGKDLEVRLGQLYPEADIYEHKVKTMTKIEKEVGKKNFDSTLTVQKITDSLRIEDQAVQDTLGALASYGKMIGLNIDE